MTVAVAVAILWNRRTRPAARSYRLELPPTGRAAESDEGSIHFVGTATTLIRFGGMTILTDPNFLHRGEQVHIGYGLHSTRLTDPSVSFDELPPVDLVLLSHLHEDHFDKLVQKRLRRDMPIFTTESAARTLGSRGFTRTYPMRTWDSAAIRKGSASLRITSLPGTHGPLLASALLPAVMGSMLEFRNRRDGEEYRVYVSGDTLVFSDLLEIPKQYPQIDLAVLHLGGTRVMGILVTMDAKQGIQALRIVGADLNIPVHYDDYDVFKDPLSNFVREVEAAGLQDRVQYLQRGETYSFAARKIYHA
ncbi:MAG: L-ascorbate metabolism protein UlaG, beta-lactamase superfamily [Candidatus Solibacter sp.]|nr:L-ascorbate metabolism protein UlaG, beta-lactamase superfamily [Candidatus Solibacter sp.]